MTNSRKVYPNKKKCKIQKDSKAIQKLLEFKPETGKRVRRKEKEIPTLELQVIELQSQKSINKKEEEKEKIR